MINPSRAAYFWNLTIEQLILVFKIQILIPLWVLIYTVKIWVIIVCVTIVCNESSTLLKSMIKVIYPKYYKNTWVLYMCSSFWLLGVESHDFFQAEKERTACKAKQIHKMTIICSQNDNLGLFWVKTVVILWICSTLQAVLSFSAWEKLRDSTPNSQKLEDMYRT